MREVLDQDWDMVIAHPPCDHLASSGASLEPTDVVEPESRKVYASGKSMPPWYANASGKDRKKD